MTARARGVEFRDDQAYLPAPQSQPGPHPRLPSAHGHPQRPQGHRCASPSGPQASRHDHRRQVSRTASESSSPAEPVLRAPSRISRATANQAASRVLAGPTGRTQAPRATLHRVRITTCGRAARRSIADAAGHHCHAQDRQRRGAQPDQATGPGSFPTPSGPPARGPRSRLGRQTTSGACRLRGCARRLRRARPAPMFRLEQGIAVTA
jgi:hypothetical protein